ncbi:DMT family transporter [Ancylobacter radicis]|uniref:Guanidinium exporter n=1 Tax=Ancylobacter radicis TaxID=2836179 RepID=A0ABS5R856_9HYPH|nr:multidrug efflux SMR transporter [Ancylobacter radicis]MBS9476547.1 multidrug efflux SMR transporter [Ancylobacter radicis]
MAWIYLLIASLFEMLFAVTMKYADGFSRVGWSIFTVAAGIASLLFLTAAMKTLPVSVAYPAWTAVGSVGTVILGAVLFNEPLTAMKIVCVGAIVAGIIGLRLQAG